MQKKNPPPPVSGKSKILIQVIYLTTNDFTKKNPNKNKSKKKSLVIIISLLPLLWDCWFSDPPMKTDSTASISSIFDIMYYYCCHLCDMPRTKKCRFKYFSVSNIIACGFEKKKNPSFSLFPLALQVATTIQYSERMNIKIIMYFCLHSQQCYFSFTTL